MDVPTHLVWNTVYLSAIANVMTLRNLEDAGEKFNIVGMCIIGNCVQNGILIDMLLIHSLTI
jgi:hypothetical protein